ncbi:uncharacterized protein LOC105159224 [Sesamum indicum]|uniref:Uncharacterized protein LOC105159224 n=1 Tax=Sesamum indicum TaxID=4182 RepID=A0A6I9SW76_SESIN|nr:uncharacterized protein LOC105159224 [Sesamum indicum]
MKLVAEILTGSLFFVEVEDDATVGDLKKKIGEQENLPTERLILMLDADERLLLDRNDVCLKDYGVQDSSHLYIFFKPLDHDSPTPKDSASGEPSPSKPGQNEPSDEDDELTPSDSDQDVPSPSKPDQNEPSHEDDERTPSDSDQDVPSPSKPDQNEPSDEDDEPTPSDSDQDVDEEYDESTSSADPGSDQQED